MIGREVGSYVLERKLGEGGMGEVYLGRHKNLDTFAAIKVMSPAFSHDPRLRERFSREARTQAQLRHPNVAQVLDHVEQDGRWFLIVEYMGNGTLEEALGRSPKPAVGQAVAWVKQALRGLNFAHGKGIIHRDVKPANLLLNDHGEVAVTDFGIAMEVGGRKLTQTGSVIGTPEYMSPEQIKGSSELDHRTDLYSMGVVLYELLAGRRPFESTSTYEVQRAQVSEPPPPIREINPEVPPQLEAIVMRALAKVPAERYSSCGEMADVIEAYERGLAPPAPPGGTKFEPPLPAAGANSAPPAPPGLPDPRIRPDTVALPAGVAPPTPPLPVQRGRRPGGSMALGLAALLAAISLSYLGITNGWFDGLGSRPSAALVKEAESEAERADGARDDARTAQSEAEDQARAAEKAAGQGKCGEATAAAARSRAAADRAAAYAREARDAAEKARRAAVELGKKDSARDLPASENSASRADSSATEAESVASAAAASAARAEEASGRCTRPQEPKPQPVIEPKQRRVPPPPALPEKPTVAVIVTGDPIFGASLQPTLEARLRRSEFDVQDANNSLEISALLDREGERVDVQQLVPLLVEAGFHVVVLVKVEVGEERRARLGGQEMSLKAARVRLNAHLLPSGKSIGHGWSENVEYTELSAKALAERAFLRSTVDLVRAIRSTWDSVRGK